jgi:hypothetical protein
MYKEVDIKEIETKFQLLASNFVGPAPLWNICCPMLPDALKSNMAAIKPAVFLPQLVHKTETKFQRLFLLLESINSMVSIRVLHNQTGSLKSKMAVSKLQLLISQLVDQINSKV